MSDLLGMVCMASPFPLLIWMAVSLGRQRGAEIAYGFFAVAGTLLGLIYFGGLMYASVFASQGHPGRAAIGVGATILYSYGMLLVALIARCRLGQKAPHDPRR